MRKLAIVLVVLLLLGGATAMFWPRNDAWALLDRAIVAHGGKERAAQLDVGEVIIQGTEGIKPQRVKLSVEETFSLPGRIRRVETKTDLLGRQTTKRSVLKDGKMRTRIDQGPVEMREGTLADERNLLVAVLPMLIHFREQDFQLARIADARVEGRVAHGIKVLSDGEALGEFYFDEYNNLLVKSRYRIIDPETNEPCVEETVFTEYKRFNDIPLPTHIVITRRGMPFRDLWLTSVRLSGPIEDKLFDAID